MLDDSSTAETSAPRVLVGLCTLNEASNIESMIRDLSHALPHADLLVIDDDSSDGTGDIVKQLGSDFSGLRLITRQGERGLGSAIRRAMSESLQGSYDFFLNLDADRSHDPHQLPDLLTVAVDHDDVDVVIGSRYVKGGAIDGWPIRRRVMSKMVNRFATTCLRIPVNDCSGSMRCYRVSALRAIGVDSLKSDGYSVLEEVLIKLHRNGSKMSEVPITFTDRVEGESKLTTREAVRSIWRMLQMAVRPPQ